MSKAIIISALLAFAEARFGQEGLVQNAISSLGSFGNPGEAATLAGGSPGVLLGGANACAKVRKEQKPFPRGDTCETGPRLLTPCPAA